MKSGIFSVLPLRLLFLAIFAIFWDSSMNDLGDVQHLERMQEESKSAPKLYIPKYYKHRTAIWPNKKQKRFACTSSNPQGL